jgi:chaperonin GroES
MGLLKSLVKPKTSGIFAKKEKDVANFRPLGDRVLVKRVKEEEKTKGGIIIPDTAKEKPQEGEVVAVGPGARDEDGERIAMDLQVGDRILFGKWSGTEVTLDGEELLIMKESDVMGVVSTPAASKGKSK